MKTFLFIYKYIFNLSENKRQFYRLLEKATSRITHQKIQMLWQTQAYSKTQGFPFGQLVSWKSNNEVYSSKKYKGFSTSYSKIANCQGTVEGVWRNQYRIIFAQTTVKTNHEFSLRSHDANSCHSKYAARFLTVGGRA